MRQALAALGTLTVATFAPASLCPRPSQRSRTHRTERSRTEESGRAFAMHWRSQQCPRASWDHPTPWHMHARNHGARARHQGTYRHSEGNCAPNDCWIQYLLRQHVVRVASGNALVRAPRRDPHLGAVVRKLARCGAPGARAGRMPCVVGQAVLSHLGAQPLADEQALCKFAHDRCVIGGCRTRRCTGHRSAARRRERRCSRDGRP